VESAALRDQINDLEAKLQALTSKLSAAPTEKASSSVKPPVRLLGFDFDCTLTVRHFYKVFAWGYLSGNAASHPHYQEFVAWCKERGIDPAAVRGEADMDRDFMAKALDDFTRRNGEEAFSKLFRELFLGGEDRIRSLAQWLERLDAKGVQFAIITAGTSTAVLRGLNCAPELRRFIPSSRVWDCSQGRHSIRSVMGQKVLILRDLCPEASGIVLVDDSFPKDTPPSWAPAAAGVTLFEGLPYEGPGLSGDLLEQVEKEILKGATAE